MFRPCRKQTVGGLASGAVAARGNDEVATVCGKGHGKMLTVARFLGQPDLPFGKMPGQRRLKLAASPYQPTAATAG